MVETAHTASAAPEPESPAIDLSALSPRALLNLDSAIIAELKRRGLVRGNNKPLGDIAEHVVLLARGGVLEPNSTKSHDVTTPSGRKMQVKARIMSRLAEGFSPFRSFDFDTAIFLVFDPRTLDLTMAREVSSADVASGGWVQAWTRSNVITGSRVQALGDDVTDGMRAAYAQLG